MGIRMSKSEIESEIIENMKQIKRLQKRNRALKSMAKLYKSPIDIVYSDRDILYGKEPMQFELRLYKL